MAGRIKLLFLASTPPKMSRLRVGAEAARIKEALNSSPDRNRFEFDENHAVRLDQLQQLVVDAAAQVVHFAGHGASTGELVFEDHDGNPRPANPAAIKTLFELAGEQTRLVVLNACYSHDQAQAIAEHVDVVIGTSAALADPTAIAFSSELYRCLARGFSIGKAFKLAKNHVNLQDLAGERRDIADDKPALPGAPLPRIVHGSDVDPDKIFLTGPRAVAARALGPPVPDRSGSVLDHIRALVAADQLGEALELLGDEEAPLTAQQLDELTLMQRQWNQIEREEDHGAGPSNPDASRASLARGILQILREIDRRRPAPGPLRSLDSHELRIRATYLKHTRRHLQNLMDESIHNARFLDLGIADAPVATHLPWVYKNPDSTLSFGSVEEAFRIYDRRLLLLGGPGAGKTVTLQHLALALIGEADADPAAPIPLIVNLSGFRFDASAAPPSQLGRLTSGRTAPPPPDRSFEAWLAGELVERRVDRAVAQRWVAEGRIAAFLDGLDEVNDERRAELAVLLNTTFLHDHPDTVVVVCSRIDDYRPLQGRVSTRLQLPGAVTLQPLGPAQIDAYLEAAEATGLREALGRDNSLSELAQTPLTLSMMTLAYGGKSMADIPPLPRLADQRHHLMESFVARMLQRKERRDRGIPFDDNPDNEVPAARYRYHPDQVNRYLSWLAVRLSMRMQTACSLPRLFGFLALREPVEESRSTSWIMRLSKTAVLAIVMAVAALALAPANRAGVIGGAGVLLACCGLQAGVLEVTPWKEKISDSGFVPVVGLGLCWWAAVSHGLVAVWPAATAIGLGLIALSGAIAIGAALVAWLKPTRPAWLIPGSTVVGGTLGAGAIHAGAVQVSADTVVAASMVGGQLVAILILLYRDAATRGEAWRDMGIALGVAVGLAGVQAGLLWLLGSLPWPLALGLVGVSSTLMLWLLERPAAALLGLALLIAAGSALGGRELGILGGGAWGIALVFVMIAAGSSTRVEQAVESCNVRVEHIAERSFSTPAARVVAALSRILPWRLHSFLRYGGQALILKPFSGEIEFVHRRLRDYFALRELVPRLQDPDARRRTNAIGALGFQGVSAIDTLAELLTEGTLEERVAAIGALGRISAPEVAGHLRRAFADPDARVRQAVVANLRNLDPFDAEDLTLAAMADPDLGVVKIAIEGLRRFRQGRRDFRDSDPSLPEIYEVLIRHLAAADAHAHDLVRHVVAKAPSGFADAFGARLPAGARPIVTALLADPDTSVRQMMCQWMAHNRRIADVEALASALQDRDAAVRIACVEALGSMPGERTAVLLLHALTDPVAAVRAGAAEALGERREERAAESLLGMAADRDADARAAALAALGKLGRSPQPRTVDVLIRALRDRSVKVRTAAVSSLRARTDPRAVEPLSQTLADKEPEVRSRAAWALAGLRDSRAVEPLIRTLADKEAEVRSAVAGSLGTLRDPRAVEPLIRTLADKEPEVRSEAAASLGALRDPRAVEPLLHALADPHPRVRSRAAGSLGTLGDPRAVEPLLRALADKESAVRSEAAGSLGTLGDPRAVEPLAETLTDRGERVRANAAASLARLGAEDVLLQWLANSAQDGTAWRWTIRSLAGLDSSRVRAAVHDCLSTGSPETRRAIVEELARARGHVERALLSEDCDEIGPWIDPQKPITQDRIDACSDRLRLSAEDVRAHYEALAPAFGLRLSWT